MRKLLVLLGLLGWIGIFPALAWAEATSAAKTILTVRGKTADGAPVDFDAKALEALGVAEIRTRTQWLGAAGVWQGVPLQKVLARVGARGDNLRVRALNDYSAVIPVADVARFGPILAWRLDGKLLGVRERGPLIVIYPYDSDPALNFQMYHDRAVWQVRDIVVE